MNNQDDDPSNQQHLETKNADLRHKEKPRENTQKTLIISDQETNEVNYSEFSLSTSSPLSSANSSRSGDKNKQDLSILEKFSDASLSSPCSSGNEKLTLEKRTIYIPEHDQNDITLECINEDVNYETKVTTFALNFILFIT